MWDSLHPWEGVQRGWQAEIVHLGGSEFLSSVLPLRTLQRTSQWHHCWPEHSSTLLPAKNLSSEITEVQKIRDTAHSIQNTTVIQNVPFCVWHFCSAYQLTSMLCGSATWYYLLLCKCLMYSTVDNLFWSIVHRHFCCFFFFFLLLWIKLPLGQILTLQQGLSFKKSSFKLKE